MYSRISNDPSVKEAEYHATMVDHENLILKDKLCQFLIQDRSHQIVSVVPLESSNTNRRRHLVIVSAPADRDRNSKKFARSHSFHHSVSHSHRKSSPFKKSRQEPGLNHSDEDYCLLGVDSFNGNIRLGMVFKILWGTQLILDGDGGFRYPHASKAILRIIIHFYFFFLLKN